MFDIAELVLYLLHNGVNTDAVSCCLRFLLFTYDACWNLASGLFCDPQNGSKNNTQIRANKSEGALCAFSVVGLNSVSECGTKFGATFGVVVVVAVAMVKRKW